MGWKHKVGWVALGFGILILVGLVGGYAYLRSSSFQRFAVREIETQADQATGGRTRIGSFDFSLSGLTANLYDITLRGAESQGQPALLHADKLTVQAKVVSLLHRQFSLRELLIVHPVVHVEVSPEGKSNLPTPPPSKSSSNTSVFDLAIGHVQITDGEVDYNDRKTPLDADLYDLGTDIRFSAGPARYEGVVSYDRGTVGYAAYHPLPHSLNLRFSATPEQLKIESTTVRVGGSDLSFHGDVANYSNPVANGTYAIRIHTQDFAQMLQSAQADGDIFLTGQLHYEAQPNEPALKSVAINGHIASEALMAAMSGKRIELKKLEGEYQLANGNLIIRKVDADTLGGRISADGEINGLDATQDARFHAVLRDISLTAIQRTAATAPIPAATISGRVAGTAEAAWKGSIANLQARSDLAVKAEAASRANARSEQVPVTGSIHVRYDGARQSVELNDTAVTIPTASLTAKGTVSDRSNLQLNVVAEDLHQLELIADTFRAGQNPPPAVSGRAALKATVQGSMKRPTISAQFNAEDVRVQGSAWKSASLTLRANPSELQVENGRLVNANQGQASFSANVKLHNWSYSPSDRIQAELNAQQFRITDLQQLANQNYPVSGELSAKLAFDGTQLEPSGHGQVEVANANVYGEPVQKLAAKFHTDSGSIVSDLNVDSNAGRINGDLSFTPKTKAYKVKVDAPGIVLQRLRQLQEKNLQLTGTVTASISGEGTVDDPQLTATVELPDLQAKGKSISETKLVARILQHQLNANLNSKVSQIEVRAQAQVALTGDYQAQANVDTGTIPLDTLAAAFESNVPQGFQGQTELHASLRGPLKYKDKVEANLSIPVLKASYQSLQLGITHPVRADYSHSVVTLQPTDIEGTDTSLHLRGRMPVGTSGTPDLSATGSINLKIAQILLPNIRSSGLVALDIRAAGESAKPGIQGQVKLQDIAVATPDAPVGVEQLNGTLDISNDKVQVSQMTGKLGGGTFSVGGAVTYRPNLHFNLAVQSQSVRLLYPTGLRTLLDANLAFSGTTTASTLNGRVLIDNLSFTPDFDLSNFADQFDNGGTVSQPGFADTIKLAVAVQSQQSLNASSSQVSIAGQVALQVGGTAANPVITGRTTLNSGEVFFRNVRYQLQRGVITFDDPNETHPVMNLSVNTTIEQYNLTLTMRGPLDKLTTSYVSDPPLATADIINLVARGKTTQESAASTQSTDSMIASQAASELSSSVQKLAGLSSLEIDPTLGGNGQNPSARIAIQQRVTKNLLFTFSTDVSQPGSEIVQGDYQINKKWSVTVERDQLGGVSMDGKYHTRF